MADRRKFIEKGVKSLFSFGVSGLDVPRATETEKFLTAHGELIEIDTSLIGNIKKTKNTSDESILNWSHQVKIKP